MERTASFASRIREYRIRNGLTLQQLADKIHVPPQTINRYERGERVPKIDIAMSIADMLKLNPLWLQGYDVEPDEAFPFDVQFYSGYVAVQSLKEKPEEPLAAAYRKLNEEGRKKLLAYADDLIASGKYVNENPERNDAPNTSDTIWDQYAKAEQEAQTEDPAITKGKERMERFLQEHSHTT